MGSEGFNPNDASQNARLEERYRLALYLHDSIGQILCLTKLQLTRIQDAIRQPLDVGRQAWLQTTVESLIREMDTAMHAVKEKLLDLDVTPPMEGGLAATVEQECGAFIRRTGIPCERHLESLDFDAERSALVVLIVQEALSNVARHSEATNVEVMLQHAGERGILTVRDDGRGMERSRMTAISSIGLRGMDERARALAGDLTIDSTPDEGTRITLSFPLRPRRQNTSRPD
jgi:two-component system, NarL family, sensor histidine kinase UhpB